MAKKSSGIDQFFLKAEQLAEDVSLIDSSSQWRPKPNAGLLTEEAISEKCESLAALNVDDYIEQTVAPSEDQNRVSAKTIIQNIDAQILKETQVGPLYAAELLLDFSGTKRRVGVIAQDRSTANGVWMPEHHLKAVEIIRDFSQYSMPLVTFIDTPGADAGEIANSENQAHSISHLIAEMANIDIPVLGIILGNGYSGGAIPLATANLLLSVKDGVFNTIQPKGLASIARKYDLSWQECAKYVGVSSYELFQQGYIDGVIDFQPNAQLDGMKLLTEAICGGIVSIEEHTRNFVSSNDYVIDHYTRSVSRYLDPSDELSEMEKLSSLSLGTNPTSQVNVFGVAYRYLRYIGMRGRIKSMKISSYGRLSDDSRPKGDFKKRRDEEMREAFVNWLKNPLQIRYDDQMNRFLKNYEDKKEHAEDKRNKIASLIFGDPKSNFELSRDNLIMVYGFNLYNLWKSNSQNNFVELIKLLQNPEKKSQHEGLEQDVLDVVLKEDFREFFIVASRNFLIFDLVYDELIFNLRTIAREAKEFNTIAKDSVQHLIENSLTNATKRLGSIMPEHENAGQVLRQEFYSWVKHFVSYPKVGEFLKGVESWKKIMNPRISEPLFAITTFFFETLLPRYYEAEINNKTYDGSINPKQIGLKDFWNRLNIAYTDLLVQDLQIKDKKQRKSPSDIIQHFFYDFEELDEDLMSPDPVNFPGFRISIEDALDKDVKPCGVVTGLGRFRTRGLNRRVGVVVSNMLFQAGAFDMASAEKFCKLLVQCAKRKLPVVCFISSGGMQTKEGAGALFSMSIVNDRITRFVRDNDLPIICFGYGDCTGGAQASFVTHPLVQTYYYSGTNMPFAGQIVVPSYLPSTSTLSNYLSKSEGAMQGLVKHPFYEDMEQELREIDAEMPLPRESVEEVCERILKGGLVAEEQEGEVLEEDNSEENRTVKKVLIHARGCTAVKLIRIAQEQNLEVVLAQSDPDMDSVPAEMLREQDYLVCIGGNTPDESYLNALSVIRVAEQEGVDSLHPGIGFLSENASFNQLCRNHNLNFIGPSVANMERMGNKSNAIATARRCNVPVVPGSLGILANAESATQIAANIGYPVLIKAVHGGGGKGIQVVEKPEDFVEIYHRISAEARAAFGNGDLYLEKYVTSLRHVEIQILRDHYGNTKVLGLRDCSVQRNNQKVFEESTSTMLPRDMEEQLYTYAESLADEINYIGAGTVEFIFDLLNNTLYFMEMNTRLQVEHPVTELVTNTDIVARQFDIAAGGSIADLVVNPEGYAMEVRVTAEKATIAKDGTLSFVPNPGDITEYHLPENAHVKVISMIDEGKSISPYYDSLIMQIIAYGPDRNSTMDTLYDYLGEMKISGVCTNIPVLRKIIKDDIFIKGDYDTNYLEGFFQRTDHEALIKEIEEASGENQGGIDISNLQIEGSDEIKVLSPQAGVFYLSPSPAEPDFVKVGDEVNLEQTLCLLEAMKLFTSLNLTTFNKDHALYSSASYTLVRTVPVSGQAVNKGDLLFVLKPVS